MTFKISMASDPEFEIKEEINTLEDLKKLEDRCFIPGHCYNGLIINFKNLFTKEEDPQIIIYDDYVE